MYQKKISVALLLWFLRTRLKKNLIATVRFWIGPSHRGSTSFIQVWIFSFRESFKLLSSFAIWLSQSDLMSWLYYRYYMISTDYDQFFANRIVSIKQSSLVLHYNMFRILIWYCSNMIRNRSSLDIPRHEGASERCDFI